MWISLMMYVIQCIKMDRKNKIIIAIEFVMSSFHESSLSFFDTCIIFTWKYTPTKYMTDARVIRGMSIEYTSSLSVKFISISKPLLELLYICLTLYMPLKYYYILCSINTLEVYSYFGGYSMLSPNIIINMIWMRLIHTQLFGRMILR